MSEADDELRFKEAVRDAIQAGGKSGVMAKKTGIPVGTLNKYVSLRSTPSATNAIKIAAALGISVEQLARGEFDRVESGKAETVAAKPHEAPAAQFDIVLLQKLGDIVQATFIEVKQRPPSRAVTKEAGQLYNELLKMVGDIRDEDVVEAMLPVLQSRFKTRLLKAASEPGTGKRSAS